MRRVRLIQLLSTAVLLWLLHIVNLLQLHAETETVLRAGITREITDFDTGSSSMVLRGGAAFSIDDIYRFSFTSMQNRDTGNLTGTWFMQASPREECFSFIIGNYSLHSGSGLLMGKKEFMRPDPFSRKISFTRDTLFSASQGGNPAYSFFGIASSFKAGDDDLSFQLLPFCSMQRRFISEEQVSAGAVSSSLMTVNSKTASEGVYDSPVDIMNYGLIADARFMGLFHFQACGFSTSFQSAGGERILWDKNSTSPGTDRTTSLGIFAGYSDSSISIFVEPVLCRRSGPGWSEQGECIALGASLRNEIFTTSINGKFSDRDFRSVYASGDSGPETVIDFSVSLKPFEHLQTGAAFYSEKDLTVNPGGDERRCFIREEVLASVTGFSLFGADLKFSRKLPLDGGSDDSSRQYSCILNFTPAKAFCLRARYTGQFSEAGASWLWGAEARVMLLSWFSLSAGYTGVKAEADNALYAVITPASENNMDIGRFASDGNGWSVKLKYSGDKDSFFLRWCRIDDGEKVETTGESALVLFF